MDGGADVGGGVGAVQKAHHPRKDVAARHPVGAQVQRRGQHCVARQCNGHAGEQRQAQPPEVLPRGLPQQIEQGEGDPYEPCKIGDHRIFAEGDQIVQTAVHQNAAQGDVCLQIVKNRKIKYRIQRHKPDRVARKPAAFHRIASFCRRAELDSIEKLYARTMKIARTKGENFVKR